MLTEVIWGIFYGLNSQFRVGIQRTMEKETATHSSILVWRIPWTEEPGGLQWMGSGRVGLSDWAGAQRTSTHDSQSPGIPEVQKQIFIFLWQTRQRWN